MVSLKRVAPEAYYEFAASQIPTIVALSAAGAAGTPRELLFAANQVMTLGSMMFQDGSKLDCIEKFHRSIFYATCAGKKPDANPQHVIQSHWLRAEAHSWLAETIDFITRSTARSVEHRVKERIHRNLVEVLQRKEREKWMARARLTTTVDSPEVITVDHDDDDKEKHQTPSSSSEMP